MRLTEKRGNELAELGIEFHVLPAWYDVDDADSLRLLRSELFDGLSFAAPLRRHYAPHSEQLLGRLLDTTDLSRRLDGAHAIMQGAAE